jgi:hypothetical protein
MSSQRVSRPPLDRHEPIRAFGGVFGPPTSGPNSAGKQGGTPSPVDPVSRGVDLGYRVIDEYMRQGQAFAKNLWPGTAPGGIVPPDPQKLMERMYQYASDLAAVWLEYAQATMGQMPFSPPGASRPRAPDTPHVGGFDIGSAQRPKPDANAKDAEGARAPRASPEAPSVSVDIISTRRAEVTVDLKPGSAAAALSAHDLRAGDPQLPRISGVIVEGQAAQNRVTVRLRLPDDLPAGTYVGLIVDNETNLPMGMLSVRVPGQADA